MPARNLRRWTTSEVRVLMDESRPWPRYELIAGELVVTPAPAAMHQMIAAELFRILADYCDRERVGVVFQSPSDLELIPGTITQPDIFVVPYSVLPEEDEERFNWSRVNSLRLAVEVISPSSVRTDRVEKREVYLDADVAEYWVVDAEAPMVERWFKDRETPTAERGRLEWQPTLAQQALNIDLPRFFSATSRKLRRPR